MQLFGSIVYFSPCLECIERIIMIYESISAGEKNYAEKMKKTSDMLVVLLILWFINIMITIKCGSSYENPLIHIRVESHIFKSSLPWREFYV